MYDRKHFTVSHIVYSGIGLWKKQGDKGNQIFQVVAKKKLWLFVKRLRFNNFLPLLSFNGSQLEENISTRPDASVAVVMRPVWWRDQIESAINSGLCYWI